MSTEQAKAAQQQQQDQGNQGDGKSCHRIFLTLIQLNLNCRQGCGIPMPDLSDSGLFVGEQVDFTRDLSVDKSISEKYKM